MNLLKALARTSSMTMISRVLGLVRENMNAHQFGAGMTFDAFTVAFMLPNLLRRVFAEGAFSQAFVPLLAEYKTKRGEDATRLFVAHIAGLLSVLLLLVTVIGVIATPVIVYLAASGFKAMPEKFALTVLLTRITFPYILLISLSSMVGSILNTWNQFSVPAFTPTLLNVSMIGCGYLIGPHTAQPIVVLAASVILGGVLQLGYQLPYLKKVGMLVMPRLDLHDEAVWRVMRKMGPAIFGVSVAQISILLNRTFASYLPNGSISWMNYADRLMELPTGVLGVALGTILLPSLSKLRAAEAHEDYSAALDWGLRLCFLLALPATVALAVIAKPLIATLFLTGLFHEYDVLMTARSLMAYSVGLMGLITIKVLAPAYYAQQDIKTPVKIGVVTLCLTQLLNLVLVNSPLKHAGLALAISLGACFNASMLFTGLMRRGTFRPRPGWRVFGGKLVVAIAAMAVVLWVVEHLLGGWLTPGHGLWRAAKLVVLVSAGGAVYFAALLGMGFRARDFNLRAAN